MTDPNIIKYMDEHYVKNGDIQVKDIRDYGEYTVSIPVYNVSAEYAKEAVAVFHLEFLREGDNISLCGIPSHLLTDDDCSLIKRTIIDFLHEKELPSCAFREALLNRQRRPFEKQNIYFGWRKPDDTLFLVGMESHQVNHILLYEYDTFFKDYNVKEYNIDPHTPHFRGPQSFDPLEELVSKICKLEYLGSWMDSDDFMESKDGRVAACGRWELAKEHILGEVEKETLDLKIASAIVQGSQEFLSSDRVINVGKER